MGLIHPQTRTVYFAPTANRSFLTKTAAASREAAAIIARKYPTEAAEYDINCGRCTYPGWHWREDERLCRVHARLTNRILRRSF